MTRRLALCADDFGQSGGIGAGIVRLAQAGRLNAVSCLVNGPLWPVEAARLRALPAAVDVGLHLNFTEGRPLSRKLAQHWRAFPSLPSLIARAHLRRLPEAALVGEVHAQLRAFIDARGAPPRFIDGHQHVHHLPGLRTVILDMVEHVQPLPAMRSTGRLLGPGFGLKRWLIERTGGRGLAGELRARAIAHNPALLGAYDFRAADYRTLMLGWLRALPAEGGLLFCHPGDPDPAPAADPATGAPPDAIAAARGRELAYLGSAQFGADLAAADVELGPVWQLPAPGSGVSPRRSRRG